jgi:hypothetical protein
MALYYCSIAQITDLLPSRSNSQIDTDAKVNTKLREPAKAWVDSVYPGLAPFPALPATNPTDWLVNQADHSAGDLTVTVDGGSNDPEAGDFFFVDGHNSWYKVTAYSSNVITYTRVFNFASGVEEDEWAAEADFFDNTQLTFNTPMILQIAAAWYGVYLGYQILRNNPEDEAAAAALQRAKELLGVNDMGQATVYPIPFFEEARDDAPGQRQFSPIYAKLERA